MNRARRLGEGATGRGPVIYWMSRDQRVQDNWALIHAQELARKNSVPLVVVFCLVPQFLGATIRQYGFMLRGLQEVERDLAKLGIPFCLLVGDSESEIPLFMDSVDAGGLVTDFDPLRIKRTWSSSLTRRGLSLVEVDTHNIVPCWIASAKLEFGAYTLRPKIMRLLPEYLTDFPNLVAQKGAKRYRNDWRKALSSLNADLSVPECDWLRPGEEAAHKVLSAFLDGGLARYGQSNDPNADATSHLSPYLHFGQISSQRVALMVSKTRAPPDAKERFLEQLIVRRELSDNFCLNCPDYDSVSGFWQWARQSLDSHQRDLREYVYTRAQFERALTDDALWNACQTELVQSGAMHGYLRMYWAKKILEWSGSAAEAMETAIYLNDRYQLDGRDPNGYTGIAWSIGGVHDRAWGERAVFGKIRYMSRAGCERKFSVPQYMSKWLRGQDAHRMVKVKKKARHG